MVVVKPVIHLVHSSSGIGGLEVLLPGIIRRLAEYRFLVFVVRPPRSDDQNVYKETLTEITYGSLSNLTAYVRLFKYAFKNKNSIFHVYSSGPIVLFIIRLSGVKRLVYSIHGTRYWGNNLQKFILRLVWHLAVRKDYIFTSNSEYSAEIFKRNVIRLTKIQVIYNPVDYTVFERPDQRVYPAIPGKVVYCGRLSHGKNLVEWINVAVFLKRRFPSLVFEIFGEGPEEMNLRKKIKDENLGNFISLKGFTDQPQRIYQNADLLLFLSTYESFGNVVVESILCGTPVLAKEIPSMKEIFKDFPQFLIPVGGNPDEIISAKIKDYETLIKCAGEARNSFIGRFRPTTHDRALSEIYYTLNAKQA